MYFLALSQAPPPVVMEIATKMPVTMVPTSTPPRACAPERQADDDGTSDGQQRRDDHFLDRGLGQHVHAVPYSGLPVPSMMPWISLNWRRTSTTTEPAARPTASMPMAANR